MHPGTRNVCLMSLLLSLAMISGHHLHDPNKELRGQRVFAWPLVKKNVFISRGWGASGMPLSTVSTTEAQPNNGIERTWTSNNSGGHGNNRPKTKFMRQLANQAYLKPGQRNYSIPQLFVSYGWGPMG